MSTETASPPAGGQGAAQVSPPAAPPPPAENQSPPSPPAAPPPPPAPFYSEFKNPELRGYAEKKGFPDAETLASSYMNLEKFHGVPAERLVKLPENLDDAAALKPIMEKLGYAAPKEATEYGFSDMEGVDPEFATAASGWMQELGVPIKVAQPLAKKWNEYVAKRTETEANAEAEQVAVEMGALKAELGANYEERIETGKRFMRKIGFTEEQCSQIEASVGAGGLLKGFYEAGKSATEAPFIEGSQRKAEGMTPDAARAELTALKMDSAFYTRLMAGDQGAKEKWTRLNLIASSDQGQGGAP